MVTFNSTTHTEKKDQISKKGRIITKHKIVLDYNKYMGGVDLSDSMITMNKAISNKNHKYYIEQFRHLLNISCFNSYIIFKKIKERLTRLDFMLKLINETIEKYYTDLIKKISQNRPILSFIKINTAHSPKLIGPTVIYLKTKRRRVCFIDSNIRSQTRLFNEKNVFCICEAQCFSLNYTRSDL